MVTGKIILRSTQTSKLIDRFIEKNSLKIIFKFAFQGTTTLMVNQCPTCVFGDAFWDAGWLNIDLFNPGSVGVCPPTISNKIIVDSILFGPKCCCAFVATTAAAGKIEIFSCPKNHD